MTLRTRLFATALAAIGLALPLQAQPAELSPDETRMLAIDLVNAGDYAGAVRVSQALLARDPADVGALIALARVADETGDAPRAASLAARAYAAAGTPAERFVAARIAARANLQQDRFTRTQIWLRRARQVAPDRQAAEAVAEDYRFTADLNPLSVELDVGLRPSSNINNGSQIGVDEVTILGPTLDISRDARALSGLAYDLGGTVRYRLSETATSATFVDLSLDGTTYSLSGSARDDLDAAARDKDREALALARQGKEFLRDRAREQAARLRGVSASDYSYVQLAGGLTHRFQLPQASLPTSLSFRAGRSWYGGSPYTRFLDVGVTQSLRLSDLSRLQLFGGAQRSFLEEPFEDIDVLRAGGTYLRQLDGGDLVSLSLSGRRSLSDNGEQDYVSLRLGGGYDFARPLAGLELSLGAAVERRHLDRSFFTSGPRTDTTLSLSLEAGITRAEFYGFRPVAQVDVSRTRSDSVIFDRDTVSLGMDLRSAF